MKKQLLLMLLICFTLTGCSALKMVSAPFTPVKSVVPKDIERNQRVVKCDGDILLDIDGRVISCTEGFYSKEKGYTETERKLNLREKVAQFITRSSGYLLIGVILAIILSFSGFGWVVSGFFNMLFGTGKVLKQVVKGIQRARKEEIDLNVALESSTDEATKREIVKLKQRNNI